MRCIAPVSTPSDADLIVCGSNKPCGAPVSRCLCHKCCLWATLRADGPTCSVHLATNPGHNTLQHQTWSMRARIPDAGSSSSVSPSQSPSPSKSPSPPPSPSAPNANQDILNLVRLARVAGGADLPGSLHSSDRAGLLIIFSQHRSRVWPDLGLRSCTSYTLGTASAASLSHGQVLTSGLACTQLIGSNKATSSSGSPAPLGGFLGRKMLRSAPAGTSRTLSMAATPH